MTTFDEVRARHDWRPIPDCPGRYVLRGTARALPLCEIAGEPLRVREFRVAATPDTVLVAVFPGGGLITFRKPDGVLVHTLNTRDGLVRRLARLGIAPSEIEEHV